MKTDAFIVGSDDLILVTGATGFMGPALVSSLLRHGFRNVRAFARPSSNVARLKAMANGHSERARIEVVRGNLLSPDDCRMAVQDAAVIFHLATGGDKSYPDAFMNSVVTTRNLIEASRHQPSLRRFVNISSFAVYTNAENKRLDEESWVGEMGGDAYTFAKVKQDELVTEYGQRFGIPYVIVRPGSVFGPGKEAITGRVGIDTFGVFMHLGGSNRIPLTYIDNCSDAIVLAGVTPGVEGEVFNIVDDDLPSSRQFLRQYKRNVKRFTSIYIPRSGELRVVPVVGEVFQLVRGAVAAGVQPPEMELGMEEDALQQREVESQAGMDAQGFHARGTEPLFCGLPGGTECLRSPSSDAERSPTRTPHKS